MIESVAYVSYHTSPLLQPGIGDAGGMNVYVDELARTMTGRGITADVFTRCTDPGLHDVIEVVDGYRVIHIDAGPCEPLSTADQAPYVAEFAAGVQAWVDEDEVTYDVVHSHYWLSGWAGVLLKERWGIPLAHSFHTLGRIKDLSRRPDQAPASLMRIGTEDKVIEMANCVISSTMFEHDDL
ncbi:MAG: glycosyltransferase, partial [Acidimicrobiia bacterium]|nr:glycosyltransferase [Acidimicrobiia bacterium]